MATRLFALSFILLISIISNAQEISDLKLSLTGKFSGDTISRSEIDKMEILKMEPISEKGKFRVTGFNMTINEFSYSVFGDILSTQMLEALRNAKIGDKIQFIRIKVRNDEDGGALVPVGNIYFWLK